MTSRSISWSAALLAYVVAFFVFLYGPLLILLLLSFNDTDRIGWPFRGFTLRWFGYLAERADIVKALVNSMLLGVTAAIVSVSLALMLALAFRTAFLFKPALMQLILLPILIPGIVSGVLLLAFFGYFGLPFGLFSSVLCAHVTWTLPFAFLTIYPRLHSFDRGLEEAAEDLGAGKFAVFRYIILPLIMPGIIATLLFCFTLSFDEFIRTAFVLGTERVMPVLLWSLVTQVAEPYIPAVGVANVLISLLVSLAGLLLAARQSKES